MTSNKGDFSFKTVITHFEIDFIKKEISKVI